MGINSKRKGKNGELEIASILKAYGYDAKRSVQYCGINGDADVVGLPYTHIEVKRVERLNIEDAMSQSKRDAKEGETPTVFHRKNHCEWLVTMRLEDFMKMYIEWEAGSEK